MTIRMVNFTSRMAQDGLEHTDDVLIWAYANISHRCMYKIKVYLKVFTSLFKS